MLSKSTVLLHFLFSYHGYGDEVDCGRFMDSFDSLLYNRVLGQVIKLLVTRGGNYLLYSQMHFSSVMSESDYGVCELNGGKGGDQENLVERAVFVFARRRKVT